MVVNFWVTTVAEKEFGMVDKSQPERKNSQLFNFLAVSLVDVSGLFSASARLECRWRSEKES